MYYIYIYIYINIYYFRLANIKKINDHSPLKLVHKEFLWILINAKSMVII